MESMGEKVQEWAEFLSGTEFACAGSVRTRIQKVLCPHSDFSPAPLTLPNTISFTTPAMANPTKRPASGPSSRPAKKTKKSFVQPPKQPAVQRKQPLTSTNIGRTLAQEEEDLDEGDWEDDEGGEDFGLDDEEEENEPVEAELEEGGDVSMDQGAAVPARDPAGAFIAPCFSL